MVPFLQRGEGGGLTQSADGLAGYVMGAALAGRTVEVTGQEGLLQGVKTSLDLRLTIFEVLDAINDVKKAGVQVFHLLLRGHSHIGLQSVGEWAFTHPASAKHDGAPAPGMRLCRSPYARAKP
ncbi:hypothetical protein FQZ97_1175390 [compost metagenome]